MGASLALVAHTFELSRFQPSQSLRWTQAIKLSIAYCLKIRGTFQVPRGQDHAFDNSSASIHPFHEEQGLPVPQLDIARDKGLSYATI